VESEYVDHDDEAGDGHGLGPGGGGADGEGDGDGLESMDGEGVEVWYVVGDSAGDVITVAPPGVRPHAANVRRIAAATRDRRPQTLKVLAFAGGAMSH
jgi:hypothetical protein